MNFIFHIPSLVEFGPGKSETVGKIAKGLNIQKVLCVYDQGIKKTGIAGDIIKNLELEGIQISVFEKVSPNPPDTEIEEAVEFVKNENIDALVAIGGGSSIDSAKAINILLTNPSPIHQYAGRDLVKNPTKPLIAIPTTAGTGSEATEVTVITDTTNHRKMVIGGRYCGPTIALVDPNLTLGLPPAITAATGMDALTHAIEAYVSSDASIASDLNALKAIELIYHNLPKAVNNGNDLDARSNMLLGSLLAAYAFNSAGLGMVHSIAHPLSVYAGLSHGNANASVLPYVIEYNAKSDRSKPRYKEIAKIIGIPTENSTQDEVSQRLVDAIKTLCKEVKIPTLKEAGVRKDQFHIIAKGAAEERSMKFNPRLASVDDILVILEQAY